jgi:hypothetical protein
MKKKEQLADEYRDIHMEKFDLTKAHHLPFQYNDGNKIERAFLSGYEAGQPKWISVETPPDDERNVIIKTFDYRRPKENVTDTTLGYFENGHWFYDSGGHVNDGNGWMIIEWMEIPN